MAFTDAGGHMIVPLFIVISLVHLA